MEWEEAGIEHRGTNDYGRPISVVTLEKEGVKSMYYASPSLKNRAETNFNKYEGLGIPCVLGMKERTFAIFALKKFLFCPIRITTE